jgi:hypothetical protein
VDSAILDQFDIVLLAEGSLTGSQAEMLESYVAKGGRLVAMRPDSQLAPLFGVEPVTGDSSEGYLQVEPDHAISQGIATETLQFHGQADHYHLSGAQAVAWLASDADVRTDFPAVTLHRYGQGQAALWAFDLAQSIAYIRQGNPAWANQERDGLDLIRASDMFHDWVDLDRLDIPQADEQQRLLANLLSAMSQETRPLPRLWYFPGGAQSMLIATSDAHMNPASALKELLAHVEQHGGHISIYYMSPLFGDREKIVKKARWAAAALPFVDEAYLPSPQQVAAWRARGHEFSLHPKVTDGLEAGWLRYWRDFTGMGYGPVSRTTRTHHIEWTGWVETARLQASYGIRMNLDYYHVGPAFRKETGEWVYGHFMGSGLPMKFVDEQGRVLNIYQQSTQLTDEHLLNVPWGGQVSLSAEQATGVSKGLLDKSLRGYPSAIAVMFHADPFAEGGSWATDESRWMDGTLGYAAEQGVPIWSAEEWLRFTETRHDANLEQLKWHPDARRLDFRMETHFDPDIELAVMVPLWYADAKLAQVYIDGESVQYSTRQVGAVEYGWVPTLAGSHQVRAVYE